MKTKVILISLFTLITFSTLAQEGKIKLRQDIILEFDSVQEIKEMTKADWNLIRDMCQSKEPKSELTIEFTVNNPKRKISNIYNEYKLKVRGRNDEIEEIISTLKSHFENF